MSTITVNRAALQVRDRGSGPPLVLVHGGLGTGSEWDAVAERLADRHRVVTFDSRGHGGSTNPEGTLSYPQLADDTAALIDALALDAPIVGGWSDGGQVALELAVRHPGAAGALVVGGAHPEFDRSGLRAVHQQLHDELRAGTDSDFEGLEAVHAGWPALLDQTGVMWTTYPGLDPAAIASITVPTLVLAADHDDLVGLELAHELREHLPRAELAVIPGARHESPFDSDRAPLIAALLTDFCRRHPTTGRTA